MENLSKKDKKIVDEFMLRRYQHRNIMAVMNSSMPKKKYEIFSKHILPGYIIRFKNAQNKLNQIKVRMV